MEKYRALGKVSAAISGSLDLDTILKIGLDTVLDIINGDVGGIMLLDEITGNLCYRVQHNLSNAYARQMQLKLGEGIAGKVAQTGKARLVEDLSTEPNAAHPSLIGTEGLKAFVSVPLSAKGKVLGVMNVASHTARKYSKREMLILDSIGDQLGTAIEQANLYDQLRRGRERYRRLAQQILVAQEEERQRIAHELHDETSQTISGLALSLQALVEMSAMVDIKSNEFKSKLKRAHFLAVQIGNEVSRLIVDLRPSLLDTLGLIPAIHHYTETNLTPVGITTSFYFDENLTNLPSKLETGLFRIVQAAVGNILHHSKAKNASINVRYQKGEVILKISDDGIGFDVSRITHIEESGRGAGLFSMKERTRLLGGRCFIESKPKQGTSVNICIPISLREEDERN